MNENNNHKRKKEQENNNSIIFNNNNKNNIVNNNNIENNKKVKNFIEINFVELIENCFKVELFKLIINNDYLRRYIFSSVNWIHSRVLKVKSFKLPLLLYNIDQLIGYRYHVYIFNYFRNIHYNSIYNSNSSSRCTLQDIFKVLESYIKANRLDWFRDFILHLSTIYKDIDLSESFLLSDASNSERVKQLLMVAVRCGHIEIIDYLHSACRFPKTIDQVTAHKLIDNIMASSDPLKIYNYMTTKINLVPFQKSTVKKALEYDRLEVFKWVTRNPNFIEFNSTLKFHRGRTFDVLQYLHDRRMDHKFSKRISFTNLIECDRLDIIRWLVDNSIAKPKIIRVESELNFDILVYLHNKKIKLQFIYIKHFFRSGFIDIINLIRNSYSIFNFSYYSRNAMDLAAKENHLDIVQWLHFNRTTGCTTNAIDQAAEFGHLEVVKWLHFNRTEGCTTLAIDNAAKNNHMAVVRWLHENRTEGYSSDAIYRASENNHHEMVQWLLSNRNFDNFLDIDPNHSIRDIELFKLIFPLFDTTEGVNVYILFKRACILGSIEIVKFLYSTQYIYLYHIDIREVMADAINNNRFEVITFLDQNYRVTSQDISTFLFKTNQSEDDQHQAADFYCRETDIFQYFISAREDLEFDNSHLFTCIEDMRYNIAAWLLENYSFKFEIKSIINFFIESESTLQDSLKNHNDIIKLLKILYFKFINNK